MPCYWPGHVTEWITCRSAALPSGGNPTNLTCQTQTQDSLSPAFLPNLADKHALSMLQKWWWWEKECE